VKRKQGQPAAARERRPGLAQVGTPIPRATRVSMLGSHGPAAGASQPDRRPRPEAGRCWATRGETKGAPKRDRGQRGQPRVRWPSTESSSRARDDSTAPFLAPAGMPSTTSALAKRAALGCGVGLETSGAQAGRTRLTAFPPPISPSGGRVDPGPTQAVRVSRLTLPGERLAAPAAVARTATHTAAALHPLHIEEQRRSCPAVDRPGFQAPPRIPASPIAVPPDCGDAVSSADEREARSPCRVGHPG